MKSIIKRKAFLDMPALVRRTDNGRQKTRNHGYDVIVSRRAIYWLLRSPSQTCHAKPKLKSTGAGRCSFFPVGGMPISNGLKDFSPKSQDAVALQQIKERGALPMIDRGDIRRAIDPLQQYLGFTAGRWFMVSSSIRPSSLIAKFKEAGGTVKERLMYEQSHRDYLRSGYLHHRLPVMGC